MVLHPLLLEATVGDDQPIRRLLDHDRVGGPICNVESTQLDCLLCSDPNFGPSALRHGDAHAVIVQKLRAPRDRRRFGSIDRKRRGRRHQRGPMLVRNLRLPGKGDFGWPQAVTWSSSAPAKEQSFGSEQTVRLTYRPERRFPAVGPFLRCLCQNFLHEVRLGLRRRTEWALSARMQRQRTHRQCLLAAFHQHNYPLGSIYLFHGGVGESLPGRIVGPRPCRSSPDAPSSGPRGTPYLHADG